MGSSPACKCVSTWGFTDAYNRWGKDGNTFYYDSNYRPKALRGSVAALLQAQIAQDLRDQVWPLIEVGMVAPVMDSTFELADAAGAHTRMESSGHIGKIVLTVAGG